jgi:hypothetical protein
LFFTVTVMINIHGIDRPPNDLFRNQLVSLRLLNLAICLILFLFFTVTVMIEYIIRNRPPT